MMNKTVSILGCGWLGAPLAQTLLAEGYSIKGSTTSANKVSVLKDVGIKPFVLKLDPHLEELHPEGFFDAEYLIIDIPPQTRSKEQDYHPLQIEEICRLVKNSSVKKCIYISSTSVYPDINRIVTEEDIPELGSGTNDALLKAEKILQKQDNFDLTILRCGGLMGYDRIPGKYVAGKKGLTTGNIPVNYIHRDDVIMIIVKIIEKGIWGETFNVVTPEHPIRKHVYLKNTKEFGLEPPTFQEADAQPYKIISSEKLQKALSYKFIYPDPLLFKYST